MDSDIPRDVGVPLPQLQARYAGYIDRQQDEIERLRRHENTPLPEDLDYAGKRVVIIGSGATAVTLVPELAKRAGHVVMLQRSPTWMIAFPVGVYSAVKQYSVGDYFFTGLAFLGMCIPTFLLALVLMVVTGTTGLFSDEFAAMEGWNWAKVADLMKHIWLPVVIVGVSSTAGMITEILGIPRGTVKSRLHSAVKALRAQEGDDGAD